MSQQIVLPTIVATITAVVVWLLLDYFTGGTVFLVGTVLKAVLFAVVFGITYVWWSHIFARRLR
ncbi:MAG TPA: hypothetical protein ENN68_07815 [Methanomicrobia archaeon]|nr:hypothetical protein [Methanomicrobia archaeon]